MFAVVRTGGKQYRVAAGDKIAVEKMPGEAGDSVTLGDVLLSGEGGNIRAADGLTVTAEIIAQAKGEKVIVFKKRRRHNYRRKQGHRQQYTILRITAVGDSKAEEQPKAANTAKARKADNEDQLVAQDAPLKVEGVESAMVDAPVKAKKKVETNDSPAAAADGPAKSEPTESEMVDAPKKKSTRKPKAAKDEGEAAPSESGNEA
jgi:large subunit ribosomal protein L21